MYMQIVVGLLIWFALGLAVALAFGAVAAQQDAEPPKPAIPPGAAFFRVEDTTASGKLITVKLANFDFGRLQYTNTSESFKTD